MTVNGYIRFCSFPGTHLSRSESAFFMASLELVRQSWEIHSVLSSVGAPSILGMAMSQPRFHSSLVHGVRRLTMARLVLITVASPSSKQSVYSTTFNCRRLVLDSGDIQSLRCYRAIEFEHAPREGGQRHKAYQVLNRLTNIGCYILLYSSPPDNLLAHLIVVITVA